MEEDVPTDEHDLDARISSLLDRLEEPGLSSYEVKRIKAKLEVLQGMKNS